MTDRDRLHQAFEETFDMKTMPGFRQGIIRRAVSTEGSRPRAVQFGFALGAAAAILLIGGTVAGLLLHPSANSPRPAGNPSPTVSASPSPTVSASPVAASPTTVQLVAVAQTVYPHQAQYGYYGTCDVAGNQAACPFTARLQAQLAALKTTACIGCQNASNTLDLVAQPAPGGGTVQAILFNRSWEFDLRIITVNGRLLVDDIVFTCPGASSGVSVYAMHIQGVPGGPQYPGPAPACMTSSPTP
jgi:hypothetical protein